MKVSEIMADGVICVETGDFVTKAAELMKRWDIGAVPVESDGKFLGMLTDRDIVLRCVASGESAAETTVGQIMTKEHLACVSPEHSVTEAARMMAKAQVRRLPVCKNGEVVGLVSLSDIAETHKMFSETAAAFCDICSAKKRR